MKGFKSSGYGPSAGFKFPASMGFSGSTGAYTNVQPYVRRKGFANGGFVRQDNPRMKCDVVGDQGSALIRRARSSTAEDQESGGKSPLRPGYKKGGRAVKRAFGGGIMSRAMRDAVGRAKQQQMPAPMQPHAGMRGALAQLAMRPRQPEIKTPEVGRNFRGSVRFADGGARDSKGHGTIKTAVKKLPQPRAGAIKGKFYAEGGGEVRRDPGRPPRRVRDYTLKESVKAIPAVAKFAAESAISGIKRRMYNRERTVEGRNESVDEAASRMAGNYARGGKVRLADGGYPAKHIRTFMPEKKGASQAEKIARAKEVASYGKVSRASIEHNLAEYKRAGDPGMKRIIQEINDAAFGVPNHTPNLSKTRDYKPKLKNYERGGKARASKC